MKIKIEIKKRSTGRVIFEYESKNNTILKTLEKANLYGANLSGADLSDNDNNKIIIKKAVVITGLYLYWGMAVIDENNKEYIKLGCHTRSVKDWEKDFWNNDEEFPNDGSLKSNLRVFAYKTFKKWLKLNRELQT